jgi:hypothetical protein
MILDDGKYIIKRTTVDEGQLPKWDQILQFVYKEQKGMKFTKKSLEKSQVKIIVSLFAKQIYRH